MSKQKESKHISIWIPDSLLKECDINKIRYDVKTRSEFVVMALEFYNAYLFNRHISEYVNVEILNRMEGMLDIDVKEHTSSVLSNILLISRRVS